MKKWLFLLAVPLALEPAIVGQMAFAQQPSPAQSQAGAPTLSQAVLEQMLAPIALYPDDLLTQILVASTYPLEVVMANRWLDQPANKGLKGDALTKALAAQDWDPSVKSLVPFPGVLKTMSEQLDWTQRLGDAFLAQQADIFAAVQALRGRAQSAGKLQNTPQQTVSQQGSAIIIQPAQPEIVYVPAYNPTVVYGAWPYPAYPPAYYPPPTGYYAASALTAGLAFGVGIAVTSALWGWGRPNWSNGSVNVNVNRFNSINVNRVNNRAVTSNTWQHNASHRRGVGYSNPQVRQQYRPNTGGNAAAREAYRGRTPAAGPSGQRPGGPGNIQGTRPNGGAQGTRPNGAAPGKPPNAQRPNQGSNARAPDRAQNAQRPNRGGGSQTFRGVSNGSATRAQATQGRASRSSMGQARGQGGGARASQGGQRGGRR